MFFLINFDNKNPNNQAQKSRTRGIEQFCDLSDTEDSLTMEHLTFIMLNQCICELMCTIYNFEYFQYSNTDQYQPKYSQCNNYYINYLWNWIRHNNGGILSQ